MVSYGYKLDDSVKEKVLILVVVEDGLVQIMKISVSKDGTVS